MKAVVYDAPRSFTVTDVPVPEPGPGEVRIKVLAAGVCGTDLHILKGDVPAVEPGRILGHEGVGIHGLWPAKRQAKAWGRTRARSMTLLKQSGRVIQPHVVLKLLFRGILRMRTCRGGLLRVRHMG